MNGTSQISRAGKYYRAFVMLQALALIFLLSATSGRRHLDARPIFASDEVQVRLPAALEKFKSDCDRYPSEEEGLNALVMQPKKISLGNWRGPYVTMVPEDPWGHPYVYRFPGIHNTNAYDLYSRGPDGEENTADDIGNWQQPGSWKPMGDFLSSNRDKLLLINPALFMIRIAAGIISRRVRAVALENRWMDWVWFAMVVFVLIDLVMPRI